MTSPLEHSFQTFRSTGSPEALAEVYDAVAPHLLRLAMHLAVDAAAAEDLVQATFVTAIEKAEDFEDGRPLRPWLVGILTNHARNAQRKRRTALPGESELPEPAATGSDPLAGLKTAEFDAALDEAIDRIPEAYRPVLVLRLKHGMQTPEIAHALRRPAGTVRTQLVRGLEKLRDVLPAGLATGLALWAVPTRGLAAVREAVLTHATTKTAVAAGAGGLTVITSIVLMKKILTGAAALLIVAALTWTLWPDPETRRSDPGSNGADPRSAAATQGNEGDPRTASAGTGDRVEVGREAEPDDGPAWQLSGRVEIRPDVPIDGAVVEIHRGSPTDQRTSLASIMELTAKLDAARQPSLLLKVEGDPLRTVPVAADGSFVVTDLRARHLRLVLRHRYYALTEAVPVHAHPDASLFDAGDLPTYCGGHIIGRVLGAAPPEGARISYSADPDPMLVLRDARAFLSHSLRGGGDETLLGEDGRFEFNAVPPAPQVAVELRSDTHQGSAPALPLGAGETREVVVVLREAASMDVLVTDAATGATIEGADIRTLPLSVQGQFRLSRATRHAATGPDGHAVVGGLEADTYRISVQSTDYLATTQDVVVAAGSRAEVAVTLEKGPVIRGRVVDADGAPLADAGIALIPKLEIPMVGDLSDFAGGTIGSIAGKRSKVRSADDGSFAIGAPQRDGEWNVVAHCEGYVLGEPVPVTSPDEPVEIVLLRPGRVVGRVLDGTRPAQQFTARTVTTVFMMFERPTALIEIQDSEDGRFVLENVEPGTVTFRAESMFGGSAERSLTVEPGQELDLGDIALQAPCRVTGRVVDADGVAVKGATVTRSVGGMMDHPMLAMFFDSRSTRTRADGTFELTRVEPGVFAVQAHAEGHASGKSGRLRLEAGESLDDLEVQLGRGGTVEGRLLLAPGMVMSDWQILATQEPQQNTLVTDPDQSGAFRFEHLDPGRYQIQAMDVRSMARMNTDLIRDLPLGGMPDIGKVMREMQDNVIIERARVQEGEVTTVELDGTDFEAHGTALRVTARTGGGASLQNGFVEVAIRDREGGEAIRIAILEDGRLELDGLEPGVVQLQLRSGITMSPFGDPLLVEIDGKEEVVERVWDLPGGGIDGKVLDDETGEPITGAVVRLIPEGRSREGQDRDPGFALSDRTGRFSFGGLQPGRYTILVDDQFAARGGDATARLEAIEVTPSGPVEGLVLRARRGAGLEVQVLNAMGQPVPRARLLVVDPNGTPLGSLAVTATNSAGEGWMAGLPNGKARVVAWAEGLAPNVSEIRELDTLTRTRISITLEQGTEVQARVLDGRGEPLTGASVALKFAEGPWVPTALLGRIPGPDGVLDLGQLPPGPIRFAVTHPSARYEVERSVPRGNRTSLAIHP